MGNHPLPLAGGDRKAWRLAAWSDLVRAGSAALLPTPLRLADKVRKYRCLSRKRARWDC